MPVAYIRRSSAVWLSLIEPHEHFSNLDNRLFLCNCGATAEYVVAHTNTRADQRDAHAIDALGRPIWRPVLALSVDREPVPRRIVESRP